MTEKISKNKLKLLFIDILRGFSSFTHNTYGQIFIKHFNPFDVGDVELKQDHYYQKAVQEGLPTYKEREEYLIKEGFWLIENDNKINDYKIYVENLKTTKSKLFRKAEIDNVSKQITEYETKISDLTKEKEKLIEFTAEAFAAKKVNEYYIYNSFFKNPDLVISLFTEEIFNDLEDNLLEELCKIYSSILEKFGDYNLKRVALSPFFFNFFSLSESAYEFYGKAVIELTFYQAECYGHARFFKSILTGAKSKIPDNLLDEPDKLVEWFNANENVKEILQKGDTVKNPSSLVGLSGEDRERLGVNENDNINNQLVKATKAKNRELNVQEIMQIMGKQ